MPKFLIKDRSIYLWKVMWAKKKKQFMPPLKVPKFYMERGFEIIDQNNPGDFAKDTIKIYDMANPYVPPKIDWLEYFKEKTNIDNFQGFTYDPNVPLTEGIKQAQLLTNTLVIENQNIPKIPDVFTYSNSICENLPKSRFMEESEEEDAQNKTNNRLSYILKNILYQARKWDPRFEYIEPIKKDKFRLVYPKIKSVPENVISEVFGNNLLNLCEKMRFLLANTSSSLPLPLRDHTLEIITYLKTKTTPNFEESSTVEQQVLPETNKMHPIRYSFLNTLVLWGENPLPSLTESPEQTSKICQSLSSTFPDIFPFSPFLDFVSSRTLVDNTAKISSSNIQVYDQQPDSEPQPIIEESVLLDEPAADFSTSNSPPPLLYPHFIYDANPHRKWIPAQYAAKGLLTTHGYLADLAKKLYGKALNPGSPLPLPLTCNYVGSNGQNLCTVSFQMNIMPNLYGNNDSEPPGLPEQLKNLAWINYQKGTQKEKELAFVDYNFINVYNQEKAKEEAAILAQTKMVESKSRGISKKADDNASSLQPIMTGNEMQLNAAVDQFKKYQIDLYRRYDLETSQFIDLNPDSLRTVLSLYYYGYV